MPSYILRNIDPSLWGRFKARAEREGIPLRTLILRLVADYADGKDGHSGLGDAQGNILTPVDESE